jgi:hypothetical protein
MRINRDRNDRKLWFSKEKYIEKVLQRFNMNKYKPITSHLASHFKLSHDGFPKNDKEKKMRNVPYVSVIGSLLYAMCTQDRILLMRLVLLAVFFLIRGKVH